MALEEFHTVTFQVSDDWCGATRASENTIHICNREPGHMWQHDCSHGGACGKSWMDEVIIMELPRLRVIDKIAYDYNTGSVVGLVIL